jgi:hypothetical protein
LYVLDRTPSLGAAPTATELLYAQNKSAPLMSIVEDQSNNTSNTTEANISNCNNGKAADISLFVPMIELCSWQSLYYVS